VVVVVGYADVVVVVGYSDVVVGNNGVVVTCLKHAFSITRIRIGLLGLSLVTVRITSIASGSPGNRTVFEGSTS